MGAWLDRLRTGPRETRFVCSKASECGNQSGGEQFVTSCSTFEYLALRGSGHSEGTLARARPARAVGWAVSRRAVAATVFGYVVGLLPTAQLVTKMASRGAVDVTSEGTGNPGAANVAGIVGRRAAAVVFLGDAGKGVVAGAIGGRVAGPVGVHAASTAALVAHCYPVTRPGDGGKGVATSVGQVVVSFPAYFPIDAAVASLTYYAPRLRRNPRLATNVASVAWVACGLWWWRRGWSNLWGPRPTPSLAIASAVSAGTIALRFRQTAAAQSLGANDPVTARVPARGDQGEQ